MTTQNHPHNFNGIGDTPMTPRELWHRILNYEDFDRLPSIHGSMWPETRLRWAYDGGMPTDGSAFEYFNVDPMGVTVGLDLGLYPLFEEEILEYTPDYRVVRQSDGVVRKFFNKQGSLPHALEFRFRSADQWDEFKKRLQPNVARIPKDLDQCIAKAEQSGLFIIVRTASLMGSVRDWMGLEGMSYLMYDAPDVFSDIMETLSDLTCWTLDQLIPRMSVRPDMGLSWEDFCGKNGPLINPAVFEHAVVPGYRKIRNKLEQYGIKLLAVDSDGDITRLIKPWMDSGVNVFFPMEIGTWNADPMAYRKQYGREMRMIGGFRTHCLELGKAAIDAEIERRLPLVKEGGYVLALDHLVTPDTPLENYKYYLEKIRALRF